MVKLIILLIVFLVTMAMMVIMADYASAEEYYVLCTPEAEVNIRERPKLKSPIVACYFFGDKVITDGKEENGFVHVVDIRGEVSEGWIYKGLLGMAAEGSAPGAARPEQGTGQDAPENVPGAF